MAALDALIATPDADKAAVVQAALKCKREHKVRAEESLSVQSDHMWQVARLRGVDVRAASEQRTVWCVLIWVGG